MRCPFCGQSVRVIDTGRFSHAWMEAHMLGKAADPERGQTPEMPCVGSRAGVANSRSGLREVQHA